MTINYCDLCSERIDNEESAYTGEVERRSLYLYMPSVKHLWICDLCMQNIIERNKKLMERLNGNTEGN